MYDYVSITPIYDSNYLAHHGIKGQKWGVRRYQNEDGTLTEEGKKRYYVTDEYGFKDLNDKGKKFNKRADDKVDRYADAVSYNVRRMNPEFNKKFQEYKDLNKKNNMHYLTEREKWFKNEGRYKNVDYYTFKDMSADDWFKTEDSKKEQTVWKDIESMVRKAAKEHPLYNKSYTKLNDMVVSDIYGSYTQQVNYGEDVVRRVMGQLRSETVKEQKHSL